VRSYEKGISAPQTKKKVRKSFIKSEFLRFSREYLRRY